MFDINHIAIERLDLFLTAKTEVRNRGCIWRGQFYHQTSDTWRGFDRTKLRMKQFRALSETHGLIVEGGTVGRIGNCGGKQVWVVDNYQEYSRTKEVYNENAQSRSPLRTVR
jgi:hypothetical protein